jgi:hypothetical protein
MHAPKKHTPNLCGFSWFGSDLFISLEALGTRKLSDGFLNENQLYLLQTPHYRMSAFFKIIYHKKYLGI